MSSVKNTDSLHNPFDAYVYLPRSGEARRDPVVVPAELVADTGLEFRLLEFSIEDTGLSPDRPSGRPLEPFNQVREDTELISQQLRLTGDTAAVAAHGMMSPIAGGVPSMIWSLLLAAPPESESWGLPDSYDFEVSILSDPVPPREVSRLADDLDALSSEAPLDAHVRLHQAFAELGEDSHMRTCPSQYFEQLWDAVTPEMARETRRKYYARVLATAPTLEMPPASKELYLQLLLAGSEPREIPAEVASILN